MSLAETISAGTSKIMGGTVQELIAQTLPFGQFFQSVLRDPDGNISLSLFKKPKPKTAVTTVDEKEIAKLKSDLAKFSTDTLNPITGIWRGLKRLFGGRTRAKSLELIYKKASEYGGQYDAFKFMHILLPILIKELKKNSSKKVSFTQKLIGIKSSKDKYLIEDPLIKANIEAIKIWFTPFSNLLHGQIPGHSIRTDDLNYLSRYLGDLRSLPEGLKEHIVPIFEGVEQQIQRMNEQSRVTQLNPQRELHRATR
jgi:hypothetical protein